MRFYSLLESSLDDETKACPFVKTRKSTARQKEIERIELASGICLSRLRGKAGKLHVLVDDDGKRWPSRGVVCHLVANTLPKGSFRRITGSVPQDGLTPKPRQARGFELTSDNRASAVPAPCPKPASSHLASTGRPDQRIDPKLEPRDSRRVSSAKPRASTKPPKKRDQPSRKSAASTAMGKRRRPRRHDRGWAWRCASFRRPGVRCV